MNDRQKRDVERLTGRRRDTGKRAVLWDEIEGLTEKIAVKLAGSRFGGALSPFITAGEIDEAALEAALPNTPTVQAVNQDIDSTNTFINNLVGTYDSATDGPLDTLRADVDFALASLDDGSGTSTTITEVRAEIDAAIDDLANGYTGTLQDLDGDITALDTRVGDNEAGLTTEQIARSNADSALSADITSLTASVNASIPNGNWFFGAGLDGWDSLYGAQALLSSDTFSAGAAVSLTDDSLIRWATPIPINPNRVYKMRIRVKTTGVGPSRIFAGLWGYDVNGVQHGFNARGQRLILNSEYVPNDGEFHVYEGTFTGETVSPPDPGTFAEIDAYVAPYINAHYTQGTDYSCEVDEIFFEEITEVQSVAADLTSEQIVRADADSALAADITTLTTSVGNNETAISNEVTARTNADTALAGDITSLTTRVDGNEADITAEQVARSDADSALVADITTLTTRVGDAETDITNEQIARSDADTALASDISTLSADFATAEATVTQNAAAIATLEGFAAATYTLRVDAGDASGSLELVAADDPVNGPRSAFRIRADNILLDGTVTTPMLAAGAVTAGVIDVGDLSAISANLGTIEVGTANIADAAITDAKIDTLSATKITTGTMNAERINIDDFSISVVNGDLVVKDGGVTTTRLAENSVTSGGSSDGSTIYFSGVPGSIVVIWAFIRGGGEGGSSGSGQIRLNGGIIRRFIDVNTLNMGVGLAVSGTNTASLSLVTCTATQMVILQLKR